MVNLALRTVLVMFHAHPLDKTGVDGEDLWIDSLSLIADLILFSALGTVGFVFGKDGYHQCRFAVPLFLIVTGYVNVGLSLYRFCYRKPGTVTQGIFNIAALLAGVFVVLKRFQAWNYKDLGSSMYCHPIPYIFALSITSILAAWFGIMLLLASILCILGSFRGFR